MKNLKITVNGVAYDVQVEETGAAAPAAPAAAPCSGCRSGPGRCSCRCPGPGSGCCSGRSCRWR